MTDIPSFQEWRQGQTSQGLGSGSAYLNAQDPPVYLGRSKGVADSRGGKQMPDGGRLPSLSAKQRRYTTPNEALPLSQAQAAIYTWTPEQLAHLATNLWSNGYNIASPGDVKGAIALWQDAVAEAAKWQAGGKDYTPDDVIHMYAAANADEIKKRTQNPDGTYTQTQKSNAFKVDSPQDARAAVTNAFHQIMGRAPTDAELRTMGRALIAKEKATPTSTTATAQYDASGNQIGTADTTTSGGVDVGNWLGEQLNANPEAASYQGAATLFPALLQALGSPI